jgi:preprotein translocase SecE subunit
MADKTESKRRRTVKNPETFREKAVKAIEAHGAEPRQRRVFKWIKKPLSRLFNPARAFLKGLIKNEPFKTIYRICRVIGLILLPKYLRNSWRELRDVTWPSWKQSRQLTFAVLVFAVVFGVLIAIVDYGLDQLFRNILLK